MDKGKIIASGTKDELVGMINTGETLTIEILDFDKDNLDGIRNLPNIVSVEYKENMLIAKFSKGKNNLGAVLDYLRNNDIEVGRIYSEPPTLNDVFLEITGKGLRDQA